MGTWKKITAAIVFGVFTLQSMAMPLNAVSASVDASAKISVAESVYAKMRTPEPTGLTVAVKSKGMEDKIKKQKGDYPDLYVRRLAYEPERLEAGSQIQLKIEIQNKGKAKVVKGTKIGISFKNDGAKEVHWSYTLNEDLNPKESFSISSGEQFENSSWTGVEGGHLLSMEIDCTNQVDESDEENNLKISYYEVYSKAPMEKGTALDEGSKNNLILHARNGGEGTRLAWTEIGQAKEYAILRSTDPQNGYMEIARVKKGLGYVDDSGTEGTVYYYAVKALDNSGKEMKESAKESAKAIKKAVKRFDPTGDRDGDGLSNEEELINGTDMDDPDTDGDGRQDGKEVKLYNSSPLNNEKSVEKQNVLQKEQDTEKSVRKAVSSKTFSSKNNRVQVKVDGYEDLETGKFKAEDVEEEFYKGYPGLIGKPIELKSDAAFEKARISMSYDPADLKGADEDNLVIYWVDKKNARFVPIEDIEVDKENRTVSGTTPHFSTYVLGEDDIALQFNNVELLFAMDQSGMFKIGNRYVGVEIAEKILAKLNEVLVQHNQATASPVPVTIKVGLDGFDHVHTQIKGIADIGNQANYNNLIGGLNQMKTDKDTSTNIGEMLNKLKQYSQNFTFYTATPNPTTTPVGTPLPGMTRKIVVMIGDGKDSQGGSEKSLTDAAVNINKQWTGEQQIYNRIAINTVAIGPSRNSKIFKKISEVTGGAYLFAASRNNMTEAEVTNEVNAVVNKIVKQIYLSELALPQQEEAKVIASVNYPSSYNGKVNENVMNLYKLNGSNLLTGNYMTQAMDMNIKGPAADTSFIRTYNSNEGSQKSAVGNGWRLSFDTCLEMYTEKIGLVQALSGQVPLKWAKDDNKESIFSFLSNQVVLKILESEDIVSGNTTYTWHHVKLLAPIKTKNGTQDEGYVLGAVKTGTNTVTYLDIYDVPTDNIMYTDPTGAKVLFNKQSDGTYKSQEGVQNRLVARYEFFDVETKEGVTYRYHGFSQITEPGMRGKLAWIRDNTGGYVWMVYNVASTKPEYNTNAEGKVLGLRDSFRKSILFEFKGSLITKIYTKVQKTSEPNIEYYESHIVSYTYDSYGNLIKVVDPVGNTTTYEYYNTVEGNQFKKSLLKRIVDTNGNQVVKNDYDPFDKLVRQYDGNDYVTYTMYKDVFKDKDGTMISSNSDLIRYSIDEDGYETSVRFLSNWPSRPMAVTYPDGKKIEYKYYVLNSPDSNYKDDVLPSPTPDASSEDAVEITEDMTDMTAHRNAIYSLKPVKETIKDIDGMLTVNWYDTRNNLVKTNDWKTRKVTVMDYNSCDEVTQVYEKQLIREGPLANNEYKEETKKIRYYEYEGESEEKGHRLKKAIDPEGNETVYTYYTSAPTEDLNATPTPTPTVVPGASPTPYPILLSGLVKTAKEQKVLNVLPTPTSTPANGGNVAALWDNKVETSFTTNVLTNATSNKVSFEILNIDFGTARNISSVRILDGAVSQENGWELVLSYSSNGTVWQDVSPIKLTNRKMPRSIDLEGTVSARYLKLKLIADGKMSSAFTCSGISVVQLENLKTTEYEYNDGSNYRTLVKELVNKNGVPTVVKESREKYDRLGRLREVTDGNGMHPVRYDYDKFNRIIEETAADGLTATKTEENITYERESKNENLIKVDYNKHATKYFQYDKKGNLIQVTDKNGGITKYQYDTENQLIKVTDPQNNSAQYAYDGRGNKIKETDARGYSTYYTYDYLGRMDSMTDAENRTTRYRYETRQYNLVVGNQSETNTVQVVRAFHPVRAGIENGAMVSRTEIDFLVDPNAVVKTEKTEFNQGTFEEPNLVQVEDFEKVSRLNYDGTADTVSLNGKKAEVSAAANGDITKNFTAASLVAKYEYDVLGRQTAVTNGYTGAAPKTVMGRAADNLKTQTLYQTVKLGNISQVYANNATLQEAYDLVQNNFDGLWVERITTVSPKDGNKQYKEYNGTGQLVREYNDQHIVKGSLGTLYSYNRQGLLVKIVDPLGNAIRFEYDECSRKTKEMDALGNSVVWEYDKEGNIKYITDKRGHVTEFSYYPNNLLKQKVEKQVTTNVMTGAKKDIVIESYQYDQAGNLTGKMDGSGKTSILRYDALGRIKEEIDGQGNSKTYTYDEVGNLTKESSKRFVGGNRPYKEYRYDGFNRMIEAYDFEGRKILEKGYDTFGNEAYGKDGKGNVTTLEYDSLLRLSKESSAKNTSTPSETEYFYYEDGTVYKTKNNTNEVDTFEYDKAGSLVKKISTKTNDIGSNVKQTEEITRQMEYDAKGNKTQDNVYSKIYQGSNPEYLQNPVIYTQAQAYTTQYSYDKLQRLIGETQTLFKTENSTNIKVQHIIGYEYDSNNNLTKRTKTILKENALSGDDSRTYTLEENEYDEINRLQKRKDGTGTTIETLVYYDNGVQMLSYDALNALTWFDYDGNNRLIRTTDPQGHEVSQSYDAQGNVILKVDGKGNRTQFIYDKNDRLDEVINAKYESTGYDYDTNGNMIKMTQAKGGESIETTYEYNALNLLAKKTYPLTGDSRDSSRQVSYEYYPNGDLKKVIDRKGIETTYHYYLDGKVKEKKAKLLPDILTVSYKYDGGGNVLEVNNLIQIQPEQTTPPTTLRSDKVEREYDALGRTTSKTVTEVEGSTSLSNSFTYTYDIIEEAQGVDANASVGEKSTYNNGEAVTWKIYDKAGRVKDVYDGANQSGLKTTYTYKGNGAKASVIYYKNKTDEFSKEEYFYHSDGLLSGMLGYVKEGQLFVEVNNFTYTYDPAHNMTSKIEKANKAQIGETKYTYDVLNRLETVLEPGGKIIKYTYDSMGNREKEVVHDGDKVTETIYTYNNLNELINVNKKSSASVTYLSDTALSFTTFQGGWGPVEKDRANGETGVNDGNLITLNGRTYARGLGTHAESTIQLDWSTPGDYQRFLCDIGIDDECGANGEVEFLVYSGTDLLYRSGLMTGNSKTQSIDLDVSQKTQLKLVVSGGGSLDWDHADWADAKLVNLQQEELATYVPDKNGNTENVTTNVFNQSSEIKTVTNVYDLFNQLTKTTTQSNINTGTTIVENRYNGEGYRSGKSVNDTLTRYLYEYDKPVIEIDPIGNIAKNTYGAGFISRTAEGQTLYYLYNGQGDVIT
ncbi:MAG: NPCBM/NEW2 domain-containing protein, partial [Clostridia bacterium]|nr:NPCBM/NEW2 domain-containing protein [Clostridia bacterium]